MTTAQAGITSGGLAGFGGRLFVRLSQSWSVCFKRVARRDLRLILPPFRDFPGFDPLVHGLRLAAQSTRNAC